MLLTSINLLSNSSPCSNSVWSNHRLSQSNLFNKVVQKTKLICCKQLLVGFLSTHSKNKNKFMMIHTITMIMILFSKMQTIYRYLDRFFRRNKPKMLIWTSNIKIIFQTILARCMLVSCRQRKIELFFDFNCQLM